MEIVSFTLRLLHPREQNPRYPLHRGLGGARASMKPWGPSKTSCPYRKSNSDSSVEQNVAHSLYRIRHPGCCQRADGVIKYNCFTQKLYNFSKFSTILPYKMITGPIPIFLLAENGGINAPLPGSWRGSAAARLLGLQVRIPPGS